MKIGSLVSAAVLGTMLHAGVVFAATGVPEHQQHVFYRGADGAIDHILWDAASSAFGFDQWTQKAGAPLAAGNPATMVFGDQQHVFYRGNDGAINHILWDAAGGAFGFDQWTQKAGAPLAAGDPVTMVFGNQQHVFYRGKDGAINHILWDAARNAFGFDQWTQKARAPLAAGDPATMVFGNQQHVFYRGKDGAINHILWDAARNAFGFDQWTQKARAPLAAGDPATMVFGNQQHVFYRGKDGAIDHILWDAARNAFGADQWTQKARAPLAAGDPVTMVFDNQQHVFYRGTDGAIDHILWDAARNAFGFDQWTQKAAAPPAVGDAATMVTAAPTFEGVLTYHNNNYRTGGHLAEQVLTPAAVAARGLRLAFWRPVDGAINGQLLYVSDLRTRREGGVSAVIATTTDGSVYAYDANERGASGTDRGLLWKTNLMQTTLARENWHDGGQPGYGIRSTPVIDPYTGTLYVVNKEPKANYDLNDGGDFWLYALDIRTGDVLRTAGIAKIEPPGFNAAWQDQRPALLLSQGSIFIGFGGWGREDRLHENHGWLVRYDARTLLPTGSFKSSSGPNVSGQWPTPAAIWQGGAGPAADETGDVYVMTGNGVSDVMSSNQSGSHPSQYGDSFVRLGERNDAWGVVQAFSPPDAANLNRCDWDLGAGGPLLLPGTDRIIGGGKTGELFNLSRVDLPAGGDSVRGVDTFQNHGESACGYQGGPHLHGAPAYWKGPNEDYVFVWAEQDYLRRFAVTQGGKWNGNPTLGGVRGPVCDLEAAAVAGNANKMNMCPMPGGMMSISSHGRGGAIVWATLPVSLDIPYFTAPGVPPPGQLLAYDATTMRLLWRQDLPHDASDKTSLLGKWTPPTIADGKVFVATSPSPPGQDGRFLVYELTPP